MAYAVLSIAENYGPETIVKLHSLHDTKAEADAVADGPSPDYDASVGCCRLDHNQASAARLIVGEGNRLQGSIWDVATEDQIKAAQAAAEAALDDAFDAEDIPDEYLVEAMSDDGLYLVADPDQPADLWLIEAGE